MTRNKILLTLGLIIINGIIFICWQYHQNSEFTKNLECQRLGRYHYYNPVINECTDGSYCFLNPNRFWCKE